MKDPRKFSEILDSTLGNNDTPIKKRNITTKSAFSGDIEADLDISPYSNIESKSEDKLLSKLKERGYSDREISKITRGYNKYNRRRARNNDREYYLLDGGSYVDTGRKSNIIANLLKNKATDSFVGFLENEDLSRRASEAIPKRMEEFKTDALNTESLGSSMANMGGIDSSIATRDKEVVRLREIRRREELRRKEEERKIKAELAEEELNTEDMLTAMYDMDVVDASIEARDNRVSSYNTERARLNTIVDDIQGDPIDEELNVDDLLATTQRPLLRGRTLPEQGVLRQKEWANTPDFIDWGAYIKGDTPIDEYKAQLTQSNLPQKVADRLASVGYTAEEIAYISKTFDGTKESFDRAIKSMPNFTKRR